MRNIRARRYFGIMLVVLLVICAVLFIEDRIEAFVPDIKSFAESRIEEAFAGKIKLSIGDIDGGILHPITFNDISIENGKGMAILPSLKISSIRTNYRLWNLLGNRTISRFFSGVSRLDVNFVTVSREAWGFVRFTNISGQLDVKGCVNLASGERVEFSGKIKDGQYEVEIKPSRGFIGIRGCVSSDGIFDANFKAIHIDLGGHDLVCDGTLNSEITAIGKEVARPVIQGAIVTKNCVLDYRPFLNLKTTYKISDGKLFIPDFNVSDIVRGSGTFQLSEPFTVNAGLTVNNLSLRWLASALGAKDGASVVSGTANIKCDFKGPAANLRSDIHLDVHKGSILTMGFESLSAHMKGDGTLIRIEDSRINRDSGELVLAGEMDLKKIGKASLFSNIRLVGDDRAINWDGWNSSKVQNLREVTMKKRITDDIDFGFRKVTSENTIDEGMKYGDEVQLEYRLQPNDSIKVMVGQDKDFFGLEHKNKF